MSRAVCCSGIIFKCRRDGAECVVGLVRGSPDKQSLSWPSVIARFRVIVYDSGLQWSNRRSRAVRACSLTVASEWNRLVLKEAKGDLSTAPKQISVACGAFVLNYALNVNHALVQTSASLDKF